MRDAAPFVGSDAPLWRVSVTPTAAAGIADAIANGIGGPSLIDWGGGLMWFEAQDAAAVRAVIAEYGGGHATLVRAPEETRQTMPVFQPQPAPLAALSARVKESFDPRHILNPGRMYEGV